MTGEQSRTSLSRRQRMRASLSGVRNSYRQTRAGMHPRAAWLIELLVIVVVALGVAEGVQAEVVKPFKIPSGSMEPTLTVGQRVLVNRLAFDFHAPQRGEVVVFHPPSSLSCAVSINPGEPCPRGNEHPSGTYFVKRVIGLPGDRLSIRDGYPVINGRELTDEPYTTPCGGAAECNMPQTITIPPGRYFMMGDNRGDSDDSRFWGPIPERWMVGEVFFTYWPPDRIG
ncbi:MAG TPA: signal peptidase I [Solirubrobacteraceae bacterium]|nr:signal peptidase I [Solirubrobacteraceae bacterium]